MQPHEQRVVDERLELAAKLGKRALKGIGYKSRKLGKLDAFRLTPAFADMDPGDRALLNEKALHLAALVNVLDRQIERFTDGGGAAPLESARFMDDLSARTTEAERLARDARLASHWQDIGHGVSVEVRDIDGVAAGVAYRHQKPGGGTCEGYCPLRPVVSDGWDMVKRNPLTLDPSLLCRACGHHGWVKEGKWVPA